MTAKPYELFFEDVIRRVTGDTVEHVDDGSAPGMVDALIRRKDGSIAALEITTIAENEAMQMESFSLELEVPETPHWWDLRYPGLSLTRKDLKVHAPALIRWLDQLDLDDAEKLGDWIRSTPEGQWYQRTGIRLRRYPGASGGGRVDILPKGSGSASDSYLEGLADWVESIQSTRHWIDNVAKLERSGYEELHLAIRAHESGMPKSLWMGMWTSGEIRSRQPEGMGQLASLWVLTAWGRTLVQWSRGTGWRSHEHQPPPDPSGYSELFGYAPAEEDVD
ncbi:MAG TPA: hypothetical protein PLY19_06230 [Rhodoglobus sp.]|nr:hypothetical protein [Rhodoglobus sp.]